MKYKMNVGFTLFVCLLPYAVCQQLAPGQLKQKVDEIAKAYAEGYKAAITAIRARNMIPRGQQLVANRKPQMSPRSFIPKPFASQVVRTGPSATGNGFMLPARQMTVNGVEKSGIPRPLYPAPFMQVKRNFTRSIGHTVVERSAAPPPLLGKFMEQQRGKPVMRQIQRKNGVPANQKGLLQPDERKAEEMARLNAAARHRNVYFDAIGGDPYGSASGVLSRQSVGFHRRRRSAPEQGLRHHLRRHRRSRVPYLGQDLDKIGVVRAVPVLNGPSNPQESSLPSFMKVHEAEFGTLTNQQRTAPEAPQFQLPQAMFQRSQIPSAFMGGMMSRLPQRRRRFAYIY